MTAMLRSSSRAAAKCTGTRLPAAPLWNKETLRKVSLLVIVALLCARAAATFGGGRNQHRTPRSLWHRPIALRGSMRGGGASAAGACRDIDDATVLLDKLRASSETPRDEFIALLQTCVRLSEAGDVQGALIYLRFLDSVS